MKAWGGGAAAAAFADFDHARPGARKLQDIAVHQVVHQHHVRLAQRTHCLERQQFEIAGAGADQKSFSLFHMQCP